jgi:hypothetical protein
VEIKGMTMENLDAIDWEILNATADDWESLEQIVRGLPPGGPDADAVADRIVRLIDRGLLEARFEGGQTVAAIHRGEIRQAWFAMTQQGRDAWNSSEHAAEV